MAKRSKASHHKKTLASQFRELEKAASEAAEFLSLTEAISHEYKIPPGMLKVLQAVARDVIRRAEDLRAVDSTASVGDYAKALFRFGASYMLMDGRWRDARDAYRREQYKKQRPRDARNAKLTKAAERTCEVLRLADKLAAGMKRGSVAARIAAELTPRHKLSPARIKKILAKERPLRRRR